MRNYAAEANWEAAKYARLQAKLDKQLVERFRAQLSEDGVKFTDWLRNRINDYLGEG